jgi:hypothetical protein
MRDLQVLKLVKRFDSLVDDLVDKVVGKVFFGGRSLL